jgi:hypothetical protein
VYGEGKNGEHQSGITNGRPDRGLTARPFEWAPMPGEPPPPDQSGFWFSARCRPPAAAPFHVQQLDVTGDADGPMFEALWEGMGIWSRPDEEDRFTYPRAIRSVEEAARFFRLVIAGYALLTERVLDVALDGWVEAKASRGWADTVMGWRVDQGAGVTPPDSTSNENAALVGAAKVAGRLFAQPSGFRLAINDVYDALRERGGDDAFVYAYRAVEDCMRAVSPADAEGGRAWAYLHAHLGTNKDDFMERVRRLKEERDRVAHGRPSQLLAANERGQVIQIGRQVVLDALCAAEDVPLASDDLT